MSTYTNTMTANGWMVGAGYGPALTAATKAKMVRRAKNVGLFLVSPFVGLAYLLTFPVVGLAMLAWMAGKAMMKSRTARPVALAIAAPFIGLAFVTVGPVLGVAAAAWYGAKALRKF